MVAASRRSQSRTHRCSPALGPALLCSLTPLSSSEVGAARHLREKCGKKGASTQSCWDVRAPPAGTDLGQTAGWEGSRQRKEALSESQSSASSVTATLWR